LFLSFFLLCLSFSSLFLDLAFSNDGNHLIGSIQRLNSNESEIQAWKIVPSNSNSNNGRIQGNEKLQSLFTQFNSIISIENLLGMNSFGSYFLTISSIHEYSFENSNDDQDNTADGNGTSAGMLNYQIKVWKFLKNSSSTSSSSASISSTENSVMVPPQLVQTLIVHLPEFKSKIGFISSSLKNPNLECSVVIEPKHRQYLVISSR
jgi:hypothetical protein